MPAQLGGAFLLPKFTSAGIILVYNNGFESLSFPSLVCEKCDVFAFTSSFAGFRPIVMADDAREWAVGNGVPPGTLVHMRQPVVLFLLALTAPPILGFVL
jgi:hypothetical protein